MTVLLISLVWFTALAVLVCRLATRPKSAPVSSERSPRLLDGRRAPLERIVSQTLEPAPAEHVRDGSQEDLYVRP